MRTPIKVVFETVRLSEIINKGKDTNKFDKDEVKEEE
jgi:hypothetical protein